MSSGFALLPQELIDHIIDHLHDDSVALLCCATVCRTWLPASRVHLFSKIHLEICHSVNARCTRLLAALEHSPEIIPHIHELHISELCAPNGPVTSVALPHLLSTTVYLRRVELGGNNRHTQWDHLNPQLRRALESVFRLPSITYIRLSRWTFLIWEHVSCLFSQGSRLRGLALKEIVFPVGPDTEGDDMTENVPPHLEFLTLDYVACTNLDRWLDMTKIREFRLAHSAAHSDKLLHACGSSLERFHLKPGTDATQFLAPLSLAHCSNLRSLRLTLEDYPDVLSWVFNMISSIPVSSTLENVAIEFFIDPKKLTSWADIDEALSQFDSLKQVAIGVFATHGHPEIVRAEEEMRLLKERDILRVYGLARRTRGNHRGLTPMISSFEEC